VRWPAQKARKKGVNANLLDELERALATFQNKSYKFAECVEAFFELDLLVPFLSREKTQRSHLFI